MSQDVLKSIREAESKAKEQITLANKEAEDMVSTAKAHATQELDEFKRKQEKAMEELKRAEEIKVKKEIENIKANTEENKKGLQESYNKNKTQAVDQVLKALLDTN